VAKRTEKKIEEIIKEFNKEAEQDDLLDLEVFFEDEEE